ncbi:hypothetical protein PLEOSDRAFT_1089345 [Pleurotus ostreatus PC15]|uniref:Uncharacterized protein n=1 Tax=Pleurotus ostreatus (strain PC15) TaxID=1137138 RepID=A0A067NHH0_PLEO1|nr:hypothetical protein PLEOSDRAFT_1089345 [Pleurotus ostreatus PC15]
MLPSTTAPPRVRVSGKGYPFRVTLGSLLLEGLTFGGVVLAPCGATPESDRRSSELTQSSGVDSPTTGAGGSCESAETV